MPEGQDTARPQPASLGETSRQFGHAPAITPTLPSEGLFPIDEAIQQVGAGPFASPSKASPEPLTRWRSGAAAADYRAKPTNVRSSI